jgi:leucyl aminopeptidase (aminopeptidase T)
VNYEMLSGDAAAADYRDMDPIGRVLRDKLTEGDTIEITTPEGMDLTASLGNRDAFYSCGEVRVRKGMDLYGAGWPDGEASISPIEGTANGTVVWDVSMHEIGLLDEPIEGVFEDGYMTEIRGGSQADELRRILEKTNDPESYNLAETAIGINPDATITGYMRQDKKAEGYLHLAVGSNDDTGGTVEAPIHLDGIVGNATVKIDGEVVVKDGEITAQVPE